ncbi:hypothetical protein OIU74_006904 [Salix koriyanagi]|uniref:Endonuclease/exonuclease/phosphatase domain-containing protein n=1 Tax=Salix koriyanagi TaxID=2511006 RepID=A0A9Q0U2I2_9ROSI|nr:hypothetical protein OIU74_006904 [Salix koriyanagi]
MHTLEARRPLWQYILEASEEQRGNPWVIMGDFNVMLRPSDREGGDRFWHSHNDEFMDCINQAEVQQIPYNGMRLTRHNGQQGRMPSWRSLIGYCVMKDLQTNGD